MKHVERSFVHEGKFQISLNRDKYAQRLLFLFSDILVIAQPVKKKASPSILCLGV